MFRFLFVIYLSAILGSASSIIRVVPLDADDADENPIDITAIPINDNEIEISPESIIPWDPEGINDIESHNGSDEPLVFLVPNNVRTPTPSENHDMDQAEIRQCERRFASLFLSGIIFLILLVALIASFTTRS
jgi:hypothetical protein